MAFGRFASAIDNDEMRTILIGSAESLFAIVVKSEPAIALRGPAGIFFSLAQSPAEGEDELTEDQTDKENDTMTAQVAVLMGSASDLPKIQSCMDTLKSLGIPVTVRIMSAHRTPDVVAAFATAAEANGLEVIIAAAGGAAHLAGVVAAHTLLPVIGIPVEGGALNGLDSLLSTVQMPGGIPVATVGIGGGGAMNAGLLAAQIIARKDPALRERFAADRAKRREKVLAADKEFTL